ncbi:hypothetical protein C8R45DRAFT_1159520 [Mycena sanguinolenta]|nr:hypothetical protein C8R45DRAFT_1159520 [Mycena sanguinolenta]
MDGEAGIVLCGGWHRALCWIRLAWETTGAVEDGNVAGRARDSGVLVRTTSGASSCGRSGWRVYCWWCGAGGVGLVERNGWAHVVDRRRILRGSAWCGRAGEARGDAPHQHQDRLLRRSVAERVLIKGEDGVDSEWAGVLEGGVDSSSGACGMTCFQSGVPLVVTQHARLPSFLFFSSTIRCGVRVSCGAARVSIQEAVGWGLHALVGTFTECDPPLLPFSQYYGLTSRASTPCDFSGNATVNPLTRNVLAPMRVLRRARWGVRGTGVVGVGVGEQEHEDEAAVGMHGAAGNGGDGDAGGGGVMVSLRAREGWKVEGGGWTGLAWTIRLRMLGCLRFGLAFHILVPVLYSPTSPTFGKNFNLAWRAVQPTCRLRFWLFISDSETNEAVASTSRFGSTLLHGSASRCAHDFLVRPYVQFARIKSMSRLRFCERSTGLAISPVLACVMIRLSSALVFQAQFRECSDLSTTIQQVLGIRKGPRCALRTLAVNGISSTGTSLTGQGRVLQRTPAARDRPIPMSWSKSSSMSFPSPAASRGLGFLPIILPARSQIEAAHVTPMELLILNNQPQGRDEAEALSQVDWYGTEESEERLSDKQYYRSPPFAN